MIEPAPNNPATWRRIKAGATSEQLGWPEDRLARLCREHGYEYRPAGMAAVITEPAAPPLSAAQANREMKIKHRLKRKLSPRGPTEETRERLKIANDPANYPEGPPIWNYLTGEFSCGSVVINIGGKQQSRVLSRLFNMHSIDPRLCVDGHELATMIETSPASTRGICWYLSGRLAPTGWRVESVRGRCGYRLARCER